MSEKKSRRRGAALEAAILQAAWDELAEVGFNTLTMDSVALRAGTNKAAIYRRWENKARLVSAALSAHLPRQGLSLPPDTGSLRSDLLALLMPVAQTLQAVGGETMRGIMNEYFGEEMAERLPQIIARTPDNSGAVMIEEVLRRAKQRGETDAQDIPVRVLMLPFDLLRYEILTTREPITEQTVTEIVDEVFLPIVSKSFPRTFA